MIRTQIQLEVSTFEQMKPLAAQLGCSIAELARNSIKEKLAQHDQCDKWAASQNVLGRYKSGLSDLSSNHDRYLADQW